MKYNLKNLLDNKLELLEYINDNLTPKESEKQELGEVFTPVKLIDQMLDQLDLDYRQQNHHSIFSNPNLTWFDPAAGMGNFPIVIYYRLMEGLKEHFIFKKQRQKHILEKMLFMSEINSKNVLIMQQIFQSTTKYHLNLFHGDTLKDLNTNSEWNIDWFDIVIGNPPFNSPGKTATGNTIWPSFTRQAINEWLATNGYLVFIHPSGWRKPNTERGKYNGMYDLMTKQNQMKYLSMHGTKDGMSTFKCGTRYDWYILKKTPNKNSTSLVNDENNKIQKIKLSKYEWLPNSNIELVEKLLATEGEEKCPIIYSCSIYETRKKWISKTKSNEFKYPIVHTIPKSGVRYIYSNCNNNGHFGISKVIFGQTNSENPIIDMDGKYGMSEHSMAIQIKDINEAEKIKKCLISTKFNIIINSCLWSNYMIDWRLFTYFKRDFFLFL